MAPAIFPAVEPRSVVFPQLQRLREEVDADPALQVSSELPPRAELLPRRRSSGEVELRRFYWSTQRADPCAATGFTARTLYYDARAGTSRTYDFPGEPEMDWLDHGDGPLRCHGAGAGVQILRYIPLRRVTFLVSDAPGLPRRVIAKTKKESGLRATRALVATHRAAARMGDGPFAVPRPVRLDVRRRLLYLEELPGKPLDQVLSQIGLVEGMSSLGSLHRRLHELAVPGLGVRRGVRDWLSAASLAATQVALLVPSSAGRTRMLYDELVRTAPADSELLFCQGDFVPSQILCHSSGWSVIDLDDGHYADPLAEVAALYLALPDELRLAASPGELARQTYLDAYLRQSGRPLDSGRWHWFLAIAELLRLGRRTIKGHAVPGEAETVLEGIDARGPRRLAAHRRGPL